MIMIISIVTEVRGCLLSCGVGCFVFQCKGKQSHYSPWQSLTVPGGWGSQILRQSTHEGGKVVSPTHRPPLPPGNIPGTHFFRGWVNPRATVRPEGLCQWNIPMTPSGIDPATFRFVTQCLNHCANACPLSPSVLPQTIIFKIHKTIILPLVWFVWQWNWNTINFDHTNTSK
jgi:hypothetical protein